MPDGALPPLPPADQPRWRTTFDDLRRRLPAPAWALAAGIGFAVVLLAALALLRQPTTPGGGASLPMAVPAPPEPAQPPGPGSQGAGPEPDEVVVDVAGAVARPGLVRLRAGSRVADALAAAGGPAADAVLAAVNQARVLADGEQVRVPRVGEPPPPPAPAAAGVSAPGTPPALIDLNHATATELDSLPGVGPATAAAIVTWREENGGFRRVDDLLEVPGIGPTRLERLRPHVRV